MTKISLILQLKLGQKNPCMDTLELESELKEKEHNEDPDEYIKTIDGIQVQFIAGTQNLNSLLKEASGTHICILNQNVALPKGWLRELLNYSQMVDKCGLVCIANDFHRKNITSLTDRDHNFITAFVSEDDTVDAVCLFNAEYLNYVGAMESDLHGLELDHYAKRCTALGLQNFYIPTAFGVEVIPVGKSEAGREKFNESLSEMKDRKSWYIKL